MREGTRGRQVFNRVAIGFVERIHFRTAIAEVDTDAISTFQTPGSAIGDRLFVFILFVLYIEVSGC